MHGKTVDSESPTSWTRMGLCQNEGAPNSKNIGIMHRKLPIQLVSHVKFILSNWNHHTGTPKKNTHVKNFSPPDPQALQVHVHHLHSKVWRNPHIWQPFDYDESVEAIRGTYFFVFFRSSGQGVQQNKWPPTWGHQTHEINMLHMVFLPVIHPVFLEKDGEGSFVTSSVPINFGNFSLVTKHD